MILREWPFATFLRKNWFFFLYVWQTYQKLFPANFVSQTQPPELLACSRAVEPGWSTTSAGLFLGELSVQPGAVSSRNAIVEYPKAIL